jgi:hypothetical protein
MPGLIESSQVGVREDLSNVISVADAASTPLTSMIRKGKKLGNTKFEWQADDYETPDSGSVVDGTDVDMVNEAQDAANQTPDIGEDYDTADVGAKIENASRKRVRLENYGHYFRRAFRVSTLSEDVSDVAGQASELAKGMAKKSTELKRSMEKVLLGDQDAAVQGSSGYITRGLGSWTNSAHYGVIDGYYQPNTAAIKRVLTADTLQASDVQDVLEGIFLETGQSQGLHLIAGTALRRAFSDLVANSVTVVGNPTVVRNINQAEDGTFKSTIDVFQGDFGSVHVHPDLFTPDVNRGYVCDPSKMELRYGFLPRSRKLTNNGGGEGRYIEAFGGLVVDNPKTLGRIKINDGV